MKCKDVVDALSDAIKAVHHSADPRTDEHLLASLTPLVDEEPMEVPCQLPGDIVGLMQEIISSEDVDQPTRERLYGTSVWARRWLRELYVSGEQKARKAQSLSVEQEK